MADELSKQIDQIVKKWGEDALLRYKDVEKKKLDVLSSGVMALDIATRCGGFPRGNITEIFGPEGAGKTTLALWFLADVQRNGGMAAFVNPEQKSNMEYVAAMFETCGGDPDELLISQPDSGEEALDIVERLIGVCDAIILDSVADLVTRAELDADDVGDQHIGMQARLITKFLKRVKPVLGLSKTALLFTNQVRANIGGYGSSETTPGGHALRHACILRMRVSRSGTNLRDRGRDIGIPVKAKVRKNQAGPPDGEAKFDIIWGQGIDKYKDAYEVAKELEVFRQAGSHFYYVWDEVLGEESSLNGEEAVKAKMREDPKLFDRIRAEIAAKMSGENDEGEEKESS